MGNVRKWVEMLENDGKWVGLVGNGVVFVGELVGMMRNEWKLWEMVRNSDEWLGMVGERMKWW